MDICDECAVDLRRPAPDLSQEAPVSTTSAPPNTAALGAFEQAGWDVEGHAASDDEEAGINWSNPA
jgi:hypothetical protein